MHFWSLWDLSKMCAAVHNFVKKKKLGQIFSRRLGVLVKEGRRRMYLN